MAARKASKRKAAKRPTKKAGRKRPTISRQPVLPPNAYERAEQAAQEAEQAIAKLEAAGVQLSPRERRVRRVIAIMTAGVWVPGDSHRALAAEWGVSEGTVRDIAAEASRAIRGFIGEPDEVRGRILATLDAIRMRALTRTRIEQRRVVTGKRDNGAPAWTWEDREVEDPDFQSALKACELSGKFLGLLRPEVEINVEQPFAGWTVQEMQAYAERGEIPGRLSEPDQAVIGTEGEPVEPDA